MAAATERRLRVDSSLGAGVERPLDDDVLDGLTRPFKELPPEHF
jgi:L-histidine Nalpha-methyltransferase